MRRATHRISLALLTLLGTTLAPGCRTGMTEAHVEEFLAAYVSAVQDYDVEGIMGSYSSDARVQLLAPAAMSARGMRPRDFELEHEYAREKLRNLIDETHEQLEDYEYDLEVHGVEILPGGREAMVRGRTYQRGTLAEGPFEGTVIEAKGVTTIALEWIDDQVKIVEYRTSASARVAEE